jgi:hypothetical protein
MSDATSLAVAVSRACRAERGEGPGPNQNNVQQTSSIRKPSAVPSVLYSAMPTSISTLRTRLIPIVHAGASLRLPPSSVMGEGAAMGSETPSCCRRAGEQLCCWSIPGAGCLQGPHPLPNMNLKIFRSKVFEKDSLDLCSQSASTTDLVWQNSSRTEPTRNVLAGARLPVIGLKGHLRSAKRGI